MNIFQMLGKKLDLPSQADALPGRDTPIPTASRHAVSGEPIAGPWPGMKTVVFAMGCFWGAERLFWQVEGVRVTAVGYIGGHTPNPTYREVCSGKTGHTEGVLVVYDPDKVSFERLLQIFFEGHDPTQGMRQGNDVGTQYRSAVFVDDTQDRIAAEQLQGKLLSTVGKGGFRSDNNNDSWVRTVLLCGRGASAISPQSP